MVVGQAGGTGRWTRLGFALQVALVLLLALSVCGMLVHVAEWRRLRWRADLTATGRNTLDPRTEELLRDLPEPARVDVFFRDSPFEHLAAVTFEAQERTRELLELAAAVAPDRIAITEYDTYDLAATQQRLDELGLEEVQTVVVSVGERRAVLRLFSDVVRIDPGNPDPRAPQPAVIRSFRAEEALAEALKKVSAADTPRVCFSAGHGEVDPFGSEGRDLGSLTAELRRQGFEVATWSGEEEGPVPADCDVLAVVAPIQPLSDREREHVERFVASGGRLLALVGARFSEDPGSAEGLLRSYGMLTTRGIVCVPVLDYFGNLREQVPDCADFRVSEGELSAQHPVTAPLVERERRVRFSFARSFDRGATSEGGLLLDLASSPAEAWRDLPAVEDGALDFALDNARESTGRFRLAMVATFPPSAPSAGGDGGAAPPDPEDGERPEARVVGITSPFFLSNSTFPTNRDFALNAFNWLAERDFRVGVSSRDHEPSALDVQRGGAMATVFHTSLWGLPAVFGLLGIVTFLRRRR